MLTRLKINNYIFFSNSNLVLRIRQRKLVCAIFLFIFQKKYFITSYYNFFEDFGYIFAFDNVLL